LKFNAESLARIRPNGRDTARQCHRQIENPSREMFTSSCKFFYFHISQAFVFISKLNQLVFFFLRLYNLKEADSGHYICNAQNSAGRSRDYVYLEISRGDSSQGSDRDREQQEREREQQEREREQQENGASQTTPPNEQKEPKPLVIISSVFNGQPIEIGSDMKLVCTVNGNFKNFTKLRYELSLL